MSKATGAGAVIVSEVGTFEVEGKSFSALGAMVWANRAIGYVVKREGRLLLTTWDGKMVIGTEGVVRAEWKAHRKSRWLSETQMTMEFTIQGHRYIGWTRGTGMVWRGRRKTEEDASKLSPKEKEKEQHRHCSRCSRECNMLTGAHFRSGNRIFCNKCIHYVTL